mgnify:CR=1 FL=1
MYLIVEPSSLQLLELDIFLLNCVPDEVLRFLEFCFEEIVIQRVGRANMIEDEACHDQRKRCKCSQGAQRSLCDEHLWIEVVVGGRKKPVNP